MLTGKQRGALRAMANGLAPAANIGKSGITESVIKGIDSYLAANELIKVSIQEGAGLNTGDTANRLAEELHAEFIQAIGRRFVLYRRARDPKKRRIEILK